MLISNVSSVMNKLGREVIATDITCGIKIFDPSLDYASALANVRKAKQQGEISTGVSEVPFFMYNRSVLRYQSDMGKLGQGSFVSKNLVTNTAVPYNYIQGEFEYKFGYIAKEFEDIELFEIYYLSRQFPESISVTHADVDAGETWDYGIVWGDLDSIEVSNDENHYIMLTGSAVVSGTFLVFDDTAASSKLIASIVSDITCVYNIEEYLVQEGIS